MFTEHLLRAKPCIKSFSCCDQYDYISHFIDEKTEAQGVECVSKITQLVRDGAEIPTYTS